VWRDSVPLLPSLGISGSDTVSSFRQVLGSACGGGVVTRRVSYCLCRNPIDGIKDRREDPMALSE
jgi:hypothetical protein